MKTRKVCIVTCYKDPDYVRARTLRAALKSDANNEVIVIKNSRKDALRYGEVLWELLLARLRYNPDAYILTFRGYEFLPFFILLTIGKKRVLDELVNLVEWVVYEHKKLAVRSVGERVLYAFYRSMLKCCDLIIADTDAHAKYSAELMKLPENKFVAIPVSTDEAVFRPRPDVAKVPNFRVFYYGSMLPLHGLEYVMDAAVQLHDRPDIEFYFVGGGDATRVRIDQAKAKGAHIRYDSWVEFDKLPVVAAESSLCVGGPFGGTLQADMVITGKTYQFIAMGLPTLVGRTKVSTPFIDLQNCLMVGQADATALAQKVVWAYENQDKLAAIGQAGYDTYQGHYSVKAISALTKSFMDDLVPLA